MIVFALRFCAHDPCIEPSLGHRDRLIERHRGAAVTPITLVAVTVLIALVALILVVSFVTATRFGVVATSRLFGSFVAGSALLAVVVTRSLRLAVIVARAAVVAIIIAWAAVITIIVPSTAVIAVAIAWPPRIVAPLARWIPVALPVRGVALLVAISIIAAVATISPSAHTITGSCRVIIARASSVSIIYLVTVAPIAPLRFLPAIFNLSNVLASLAAAPLLIPSKDTAHSGNSQNGERERREAGSVHDVQGA
jgi:hypothetical protein